MNRSQEERSAHRHSNGIDLPQAGQEVRCPSLQAISQPRSAREQIKIALAVYSRPKSCLFKTFCDASNQLKQKPALTCSCIFCKLVALRKSGLSLVRADHLRYLKIFSNQLENNWPLISISFSYQSSPSIKKSPLAAPFLPR